LASTKERDDSLSGVEVADAQVQAAEAALRTAELNLSYTKVRAPIAGIASREARSEGSLVTAGTDSSLLTRIVQLEPLYVEFAAPEQEAAAVRAAWAAKQGRELKMNIEANDGQTITAQLGFIDNAVDTASGTVRMRAVLDNKDRKLWPGQYVRAQFADLSLANAITIPRHRRAVTRRVLGMGGGCRRCAIQPVKLGHNFGDDVLIASLKANERYTGWSVQVQPALQTSRGARPIRFQQQCQCAVESGKAVLSRSLSRPILRA
jgi:membrane fusion protein (multidrug efflux system)